jgi:hypothetical protein
MGVIYKAEDTRKEAGLGICDGLQMALNFFTVAKRGIRRVVEYF